MWCTMNQAECVSVWYTSEWAQTRWGRYGIVSQLDICPAGNSVVRMSHREFWKSLLVPCTALNSCNYFPPSLMLPPVAGSSFIQILDTPKLKTWLLNHERGIFGGLLVDELGYCYRSTLHRSYSASPKTFQLIQKAWSSVLTPSSVYSGFWSWTQGQGNLPAPSH